MDEHLLFNIVDFPALLGLGSITRSDLFFSSYFCLFYDVVCINCVSGYSFNLLPTKILFYIIIRTKKFAHPVQYIKVHPFSFHFVSSVVSGGSNGSANSKSKIWKVPS